MSKMILKLTNAIFFLLILMSCSKDYTKDMSFLGSFFNQPFEGKKYVLVIPVEGCPSCRNQSLNFLKRNIKRENIGFVLTTKRSLKDIRLMLMSREIDVWDKKFEPLILDIESQAYKTGIIGKFPILYQLENNAIKEKQVLSASYIDEALNRLNIE